MKSFDMKSFIASRFKGMLLGMVLLLCLCIPLLAAPLLLDLMQSSGSYKPCTYEWTLFSLRLLLRYGVPVAAALGFLVGKDPDWIVEAAFAVFNAGAIALLGLIILLAFMVVGAGLMALTYYGYGLSFTVAAAVAAIVLLLLAGLWLYRADESKAGWFLGARYAFYMAVPGAIGSLFFAKKLFPAFGEWRSFGICTGTVALLGFILGLCHGWIDPGAASTIMEREEREEEHRRFLGKLRWGNEASPSEGRRYWDRVTAERFLERISSFYDFGHRRKR